MARAQVRAPQSEDQEPQTAQDEADGPTLRPKAPTRRFSISPMPPSSG